MKKPMYGLAGVLLGASLVFGMACGGDDGDGVIDNARDGAEDVLTPDGANTPAAGGGSNDTPAPGEGDGDEVGIAAENSEEFTQDELNAPAGAFTIAFENNEDGVLHNIAVFSSPDSPTDLIDATDLEPGPVVQRLELDLEPGEYYYHCDSHPNMAGTLIVE